MKPTPIVVAAAGFAMLGACSVKTEDSAQDNAETNSATTADTGSAPAADNTAGADTLGNQLNQLNEGASETENAETNSAD
jgi:hypothetical protein